MGRLYVLDGSRYPDARFPDMQLVWNTLHGRWTDREGLGLGVVRVSFKDIVETLMEEGSDTDCYGKGELSLIVRDMIRLGFFIDVTPPFTRYNSN